MAARQRERVACQAAGWSSTQRRLGYTWSRHVHCHPFFASGSCCLQGSPGVAASARNSERQGPESKLVWPQSPAPIHACPPDSRKAGLKTYVRRKSSLRCIEPLRCNAEIKSDLTLLTAEKVGQVGREVMVSTLNDRKRSMLRRRRGHPKEPILPPTVLMAWPRWRAPPKGWRSKPPS